MLSIKASNKMSKLVGQAFISELQINSSAVYDQVEKVKMTRRMVLVLQLLGMCGYESATNLIWNNNFCA